MTPADDPLAVAAVIARALEAVGARYSIGGSIASSMAGEPRSTLDVDVVTDLTAESLPQLIESLGDRFYVPIDALRVAVRDRSSANVIDNVTSVKVDLFVAGGTPLDQSLLDRRVHVAVGAHGEALWVHSPDFWTGRSDSGLRERCNITRPVPKPVQTLCSLAFAAGLTLACTSGSPEPAPEPKPSQASAPPAAQRSRPRTQPPMPDPQVQALVGRLDLERYKATIKGLTQFGDRRQGTERNRNAVDWIEARLKSYGCPTERLKYDYKTPPPTGRRGGQPPDPVIKSGEMRAGQGGARLWGITRPIGVNNDPNAQPDEKLRELNREPATDGPREQVYCTKVGSSRPGEMYIIGAHMDGHGWGQAANDNGSGTALVMELARIFSMPDVTSDVSVRFVLWNNEETGLNGAEAYVRQRAPLQGAESPAGSGRYPEPRWLGMIQHDMMLWDHGMPRADGTWNPEQRPEADVNVEFQSQSKRTDDSMKLAFHFRDANEKYATDYPAAVGQHMTNTDSEFFMDLVPTISLRENERGMHMSAGWDPTWHQPIDIFTTFSDKDFRLGLNAAQTTLGAVAELAGAKASK